MSDLKFGGVKMGGTNQRDFRERACILMQNDAWDSARVRAGVLKTVRGNATQRHGGIEGDRNISSVIDKTTVRSDQEVS